MKKCPFCAEEIQEEAIKCKHCGEFLNISSQSDIKVKSSIDDGVRLGIGMFIKLPLIIIGIFLLLCFTFYIYAETRDFFEFCLSYFYLHPVKTIIIIFVLIELFIYILFRIKKKK